MPEPPTPAADLTPWRYDARLANQLEAKWQDCWDEHGTFSTPNPTGPLADGFDRVAGRPKLYVLDMFPYPSGAGLHVGHPLGYIGTDVYARFQRMNGLQRAARDGLRRVRAAGRAVRRPDRPAPAGHHRAEHRHHEPPAARARASATTRDAASPPPTSPTTAGRSGSSCRSSTPGTTRRLIGPARSPSWCAELDAGDPPAGRGRQPGPSPLASTGPPTGVAGSIDAYRLAYREEAPVNWCPALGTVLANEEVTAEGRSERGNHPVFKRPLEQWMLRITKYADRLLADLDLLDWPEPIKIMQRNWIGRSTGAHRPVPGRGARRRRDRGVHHPARHALRRHLHGAGPRASRSSTRSSRPNGRAPPERRRSGGARSLAGRLRVRPGTARSRPALPGVRRRPQPSSNARPKAARRPASSPARSPLNPATGGFIPIFVADYVLMGYGTGAIMAVPGARPAGLGLRGRVRPAHRRVTVRALAEADFDGDGRTPATGRPINSGVRSTGCSSTRPSPRSSTGSSDRGAGTGTITYKLRDWLFSRQRYWGEPFPIVYDDDGLPVALPESMLPVELPELDDFEPQVSTTTADTPPEPPLARAETGSTVDLDLGDGVRRYRRETNTMPQWAGSCWYYLRYLDPTNEQALVDPTVEQYWMQGAGSAAASTSTSAASSTRCCTSSTPGSGTRSCSTSATSRPASPSTASSTRATSRPSPTATPGASTSTPPTSRARRRRLRVPGRARHPRVREDGQEPAQRGHPRRRVPRLRRRHASPVRDVHGAARRQPALEHRRHRRGPPVPAARVAQPGRRGDRRAPRGRRRPPTPTTRRVLHRTIAEVRADMERPEVQHRDRPALRAEQPPHPGRRRHRRLAPGGGRAARA